VWPRTGNPVCVCVCVRACACVCLCARARGTVRASVRACACVRACVRNQVILDSESESERTASIQMLEHLESRRTALAAELTTALAAERFDAQQCCAYMDLHAPPGATLCVPATLRK
jgi:hypothetical protein